MRLYLIRHGETEHNKNRLIQGHAEVPLNDAGISQVAQLAQRMADLPLDEIQASDLRRTAMTASIVAAHTGAPIMWEPRFRERDPGELTNKTYEEAMAFFTDPDYHPPGGESVPDFVRRVESGFSNLVATQGTSDKYIAVICHGMVCAAFLRICLGYSLEQVAEIRWPNACLTIADYEGSWKLVTLGDASHVDAEPNSDPAATTGA